MANESDSWWNKTLKWVMIWAPGVNLISPTSVPSFADIEKTLNVLSILTALSMTMMFALAGSISYDQFIAADDRYFENEHFRFYVDGFDTYGMVGEPPSAVFVKYASISNHLALYTLFCLIIHYIYFVTGIDQGTSSEQFQVRAW